MAENPRVPHAYRLRGAEDIQAERDQDASETEKAQPETDCWKDDLHGHLDDVAELAKLRAAVRRHLGGRSAQTPPPCRGRRTSADTSARGARRCPPSRPDQSRRAQHGSAARRRARQRRRRPGGTDHRRARARRSRRCKRRQARTSAGRQAARCLRCRGGCPARCASPPRTRGSAPRRCRRRRRPGEICARRAPPAGRRRGRTRPRRRARRARRSRGWRCSRGDRGWSRAISPSPARQTTCLPSAPAAGRARWRRQCRQGRSTG